MFYSFLGNFHSVYAFDDNLLILSGLNSVSSEFIWLKIIQKWL